MLGVEKDDRVVCSLMLNGLTRDYSNVRENRRIMYPRNREVIERHVRDKYLELSIKGRIERQTGQAWLPTVLIRARIKEPSRITTIPETKRTGSR